MYTITVDNKDLYVPDLEDYQVSSATISINTDSVAYLDMDIPCTNKGLKEIKQQASIVRVYDNDVLRYKMFVDNIDYDFDNTAKVSCTSVLAYLKDSLVRPYSTVDTEEGVTAPNSVNGYFSWLIEQHNKNIRDTKKYFYVGVNQGAMMDRNNYIYRASTEVPTTSDEIKNKILDTYGAYISLTFNGDLNVINLYADVHDSNEQVIDFGVNLLDLTRSVSTESSYTAVRPTGAVPETENKSTSLPITISSIPDGVSKWNSDVYKKGDVVYSISGVRDYGYKECEYSNTDITDVEYLYRASVAYLSKLVNPYLTIDVKAVDLSLLYMDKYSPMEVGQAVRVRSEPHGVDEYLRISEISIDLLDPSNDSYTLGESYDSLTGQQSSYMKKLNSSINASFDIVGSAADAASKLADAAKKTANEADKKAQDATSKANDANTKANEANTKADTATETANNASTKADEANTKADTATETANSASTKADQASQNAQKANEAAKKAQEDATAAIGSAKDAADKAASASKKADDNTAKITTVESTIKTISGDTATAIANAKAAQAAADAAKKAADQAQSDASTANTEIGKVQSQVGTINTEIGNIKQEATDLRDDLSGQITTVKNTMEADYTRKTELSDTTTTLRNEISKSAAGVIHTVSQDYATKKELKTTTDATNKNAADLTNAINKFNSDVDNLQGQIDGAIETWFYEVDPTDKNEPAVNWTTDTLKKAHLGDLYYNTVSGYCWRYQLQNGSYSWSRITDVDVTKALADAAAAQTTANSKKRIFVTTPNPPYDVGDLWTQGSTGDIMRCQTAKTSSQSYAAADWIKASKYTDDTAVTKLSNTVEKTYSTKTEVKQLSDQVSSTVSSLETVRISAEAAQTSADNAKKAADAAQTAADTAKDNAATAQFKADEAAKNLATAEQNLKTLQSQANATDKQLTAAKAEVEKAKTAAATAQSTANTAKSNAATAQATADTAKANAKTAQDNVNALKNRVTSAETSIKQNSDAIALRATKTEVTSAIDGINVGGRNLLLGTAKFETSYDGYVLSLVKDSTVLFKNNYTAYGNKAWLHYAISLYHLKDKCSIKVGDTLTYSIYFMFTTNEPKDTDKKSITLKWYTANGEPTNSTIIATLNLDTDSNVWKQYSYTFVASEALLNRSTHIRIECDYYTESNYTSPRLIQWWSSPKLELGNKPTDWSPAPEDLVAESKTYTDAQIKVSADSITSTVSQTYLKNEDASKKYASSERVSNIESRVTQNANSITASFNSLKKQIDDKTEVVDAWITEGSDGTNPYLELGTNKSDLKTRLTNSELAFMDRTDKVAYISNNAMSITNANINVAEINQLAIYPYQLAVKNGHLLIQYIGG
nr:MAG TPA: Putative tail protein [Caudoviricetes sp.]